MSGENYIMSYLPGTAFLDIQQMPYS